MHKGFDSAVPQDRANNFYTRYVHPVPPTERHVTLDVLRGMALFGVLLVNTLTLFRVSLFAHILHTDLPADPIGRGIDSLVTVFIEFKAFTLFSFLFGIGAAIQREHGKPDLFLVRRFLVLLCAGLLHLLLLWNGDILTLYAVCGLLLIPFLRLRAPWIAAAGVLLIALSTTNLPVPFPSLAAMQEQAARAAAVYPRGGFYEILVFRWHETAGFIVPLLLLTLPRTWGVMLLGVAAWRSSLLDWRRSRWVAVLLLSVPLAVAGIVLHSEIISLLALSAVYAGAAFLWRPQWRLPAAGGRMALTNYLMQSLILTSVFYGYGLGQFGRLGIVPVTAGVVVLYLAQLAFSRWWLSRFRFGPFEWLWRRLSYGIW